MQGRIGLVIFAACFGAAAELPSAEEKAPAKKASGGSSAKADARKGPEKGAEKGAERGGEEGHPGSPAAKGEAEPQFKSAKGSDSFVKAKELFDLEQYREAKAELVKAKAEAKTPEDRGIVDGWTKACDGGVGLASYRKVAEKGGLRRSFLSAMDFGEGYRNTAIYPRFTAFTDELRPKVAEILDDFDVPSERFSKKFGKEFVSDPAKVFRGPNSLLWAATKDGKVSQIQMKTIPKKWNTEYHSVVFWVRVEGYPVEIKLMTLSRGGAVPGQPSPIMEYGVTPQAKPNWQKVEVELSQFKKQGTGSLNNVEKFIFQIDSKSTFKVYIDDILLIRKDPGEQKGAEEPETKDSKDTKKKGKASSTGKVKQSERKNP